MKTQTERARELRRNMSEVEVILWSRLRKLRERGFVIRRQRPFLGYFLDFVCLSRMVVIEVDGGHHADDRQSEHDFVRDQVLRRHGYRVLRFWAGDVRYNLNGVMERIIEALEAAPDTRGGMHEEGARFEEPCSGPYFPSLTASRSVPPLRGGEGVVGL